MRMTQEINGGNMLPDSPMLPSGRKGKATIDQEVLNAENQAQTRYRTQLQSRS